MDHTNNSCCCGEAEYFSGCLICGAPITYRAESSIQTCSICHKEQLTNAVCENGHFICDACHSYGTYAPVIASTPGQYRKRCFASSGKNYGSSICTYAWTGASCNCSVRSSDSVSQ